MLGDFFFNFGNALYAIDCLILVKKKRNCKFSDTEILVIGIFWVFFAQLFGVKLGSMAIVDDGISQEKKKIRLSVL